ncbi:MAG: pyridoxamine 5'-phosphate oxidase family protein [Actinomycetota bacterium]
MAEMTAEQMDGFLARTRQGILLRTNADGTANGAPVWFDWDGEAVRIFSEATAPKVRAIERDPRISVLVVNDLDEAPMWVRFQGTAELDHQADAKHLATEVLAPRYWDLSDPQVAATVDLWRSAPAAAFVVITLRPDRIRSSAG